MTFQIAIASLITAVCSLVATNLGRAIWAAVGALALHKASVARSLMQNLPKPVPPPPLF